VKWNYDQMQVIEKLPVHYNVGHLSAAEGDTKSPDGNYLVSLNKWSIDRFTPVGPLLPPRRCSCSTIHRSGSASRTTRR
jgi:nitrous-oxide reductase